MAVSQSDRSAIWRDTYQRDKALWKALSNLPNKGEITAAINVLESFWENNLAANKTAIQAAVGKPVSNDLLKALARAWLRNLAGRL